MKCVWLTLLIIKITIGTENQINASPLIVYPCFGSKIITTWLSETSVGVENQYSVSIKTHLPERSFIRLKFNSEATVRLSNASARITVQRPAQLKSVIFDFQILTAVDNFSLSVIGEASGSVPYIKSVIINFQEYCANPVQGYFGNYLRKKQVSKSVRFRRHGKKNKNKQRKETVENERCGRRQHLDFTELIVNGATSKPGDWPWHAAIYRSTGGKNSYICGGTLISRFFVLTAAHCVTINKVPVVPDCLKVILGKYNFLEDDASSQERNVFALKVHEEFGCPRNLDNDIALLQLSVIADYNHYVQPACIWYKEAKHRITTEEIIGTVAGWGIDRQKSLAPQLRQMSMPKIKRSDCIEKNPHFYGVMLKNKKKFCAGWGNGTSPCNGDSGGGFMVFVPDEDDDDVYEGEISTGGAWYIRGIVSLAVSFKDEAVCDPDQYVVFTNVLKYKDWINYHVYLSQV